MVIEEKTISSEMIYQGSIINLRKDKVSLDGDKTSFREIVEHKGGVGIAAITKEGKMVLVKQYRKAAEKALFEIPAGKLDKAGDEPISAAIRELKEETGYKAENLTLLTSFYTSVGFSDEIIYLFYANDLEPGEPCPDENEHIESFLFDIAELKEMIRNGKICDAKTIIAILMVENYAKAN